MFMTEPNLFLVSRKDFLAISIRYGLAAGEMRAAKSSRFLESSSLARAASTSLSVLFITLSVMAVKGMERASS